MTPGIVQVPGDVSVLQAARLLQVEHVPCLLVKDGDTKWGIVTHTDIVYKVVCRNLLAWEVEVRAIMTRPVHTIEFDQPADCAGTLMASKGVPLLIVTKLKQPIGILTARDLIFSPHRRGLRITASMKTHDAKPSGTTHVVTITQLSHVGAFIETPAPLPFGSTVTLNFYLPGSGRPISAHATVLRGRRSRSESDQEGAATGMEVRFAKLSASDQSQIDAMVIRTLYKQSGEE